MFRVFSQRYGNYAFYSLAHEATVLLQMDMVGSHSATTDALASMRLYNRYSKVCLFLVKTEQFL